MAISAFSVCQRGVEDLAMMTGAAAHVSVLAQQWVLGARVVKDGTHSRRRHLLPHGDAVAGIAVGFEAATMRVGMTRRAFVEGQANIPCDLLLAAHRLVALLAGHANVGTRQGEFGFRMVESRRALPLIQGMTAQTVLAQLAAMRVCVAGKAIAREAEESAVQIRALNGGALRLGDVARIVALLARKLRVLALEDVSGLAVVESLLGRLPVDQAEGLAVVFGMAANTVLVGAGRADHGGMEAAPQGKPPGDVSMTFKTAEDSRACRQPVTRRTLKRTT